MLEHSPVLGRIILRPDVLSDLAPQRVVIALAFGWDIQHFPVKPILAAHEAAAAVIVIGEYSPCDVILVPAGEHNYAPSVRQRSGKQIILIGVVTILALGLRV